MIYTKPDIELVEIQMQDIVCSSIGEDEDEGGRIF